MAKINLDNIYSSSKYITVVGLLKALIGDIDSVDYTPASDFTTLSAIVSTNTNDISTNTSNIASNKALINQNTANISANISANTASISTLNTKVEDNKTSTDNKIAVLEGNDTRHDSQIDTLYSEVGTHTNDISTNKTNIAINTIDIATNKANIATHTNDIKYLKDTLSGLPSLYVHNIFIKDDQNIKLSFTLLITNDAPLNREDFLRNALHGVTGDSKDNLINCIGIEDNTLYYLFAYDGDEISFFKAPGLQSKAVINLSQSMITDTVLPTRF